MQSIDKISTIEINLIFTLFQKHGVSQEEQIFGQILFNVLHVWITTESEILLAVVVPRRGKISWTWNKTMHLLRNLVESFYADDKKKEKWLRLASSTRYNDECGTSVVRSGVHVCVCRIRVSFEARTWAWSEGSTLMHRRGFHLR